jgi:hypothetical protein
MTSGHKRLLPQVQRHLPQSILRTTQCRLAIAALSQTAATHADKVADSIKDQAYNGRIDDESGAGRIRTGHVQDNV